MRVAQNLGLHCSEVLVVIHSHISGFVVLGFLNLDYGALKLIRSNGLVVS